MRFWAKEFKDTHMLCDLTIEDDSNKTRTEKVFAALEATQEAFNLSAPIWLESNIKEFQRYAKVRFRQDSFIEEIPFDYLEFMVLKED